MSELVGVKVKKQKSKIHSVLRHWQLSLLFLPGLIYYIVFRYAPMYGVAIGFVEYMPLEGISGSAWVGMQYFDKLFSSPAFLQVLGNTLIISFYKIIFYFPVPIILALMLNEMHDGLFKRISQTVFYLPHFLSWVIMAGIISAILSSEGVINLVIHALGGQPVIFLADEKSFRFIIVLTSIWKEAGWNTVIYLAAISGISPELYEAAIIDGANGFQRVIHITIPCIISTILVTLILRLGSLMDAGFEQVLLLYNPSVYSVGDILDTYVYRNGLGKGQFSLTTAAGLFKGVVGLILVGGSNAIVKRMGEEGLW